MNTDFRIAVGMTTHPKTVKLMRRCGDRAFFCLINLWSWAAMNKPDGDFSGMDHEDVEIAAGWIGETGAFTEQLCEIGLMDCDDGNFSLHDWTVHNPWAAGSEDRSDAGRLNRMKMTMPDEYGRLAEAGVTGISKADYESIRRSRKRATAKLPLSTLKAPLELPLSEPLTPAPAPAPAPAPNAKEKDIAGASAPVRSRLLPKEIEDEVDRTFAEFWEVYPRKENKKKALAAWKKGKCWNGKFQVVMDALAEQKKNPRWLEDIKYIPHPTTWINGERWNDEIATDGKPPSDRSCATCQHHTNPLCLAKTDAERQACTGWRSK
jgi:hypothetical protein